MLFEVTAYLSNVNKITIWISELVFAANFKIWFGKQIFLVLKILPMLFLIINHSWILYLKVFRDMGTFFTHVGVTHFFFFCRYCLWLYFGYL
jgi:hypothetical protein